ncbi:heat shock protein [Colletotrichum plurivorum]|uniref:Heat shock protein n=1 Tax=Colletotrichum plurivorum TaxID=2175906 RepID=A0A8H6KQX2_9PEZI|nr:heat shock protein [Colletotrichum plurivorum]
MRPLPGSIASSGVPPLDGRATERLATRSSSTTPPLSFFLADETTVEASLAASSSSPLRVRDPRKHPTHNPPGDCPAPSRDSSAAAPLVPLVPPRSTPKSQPSEATALRPTSMTSKSPDRLETTSPTTGFQPMTPILYGASGPCSAISSSSSRPDSLSGSLSEYQESFIMSAFGASESAHPQSTHSAEGAQQFIMPTVHVPRRRPFTEVGKSLGRLKILIAGKSGLGKTSLIQAITHSSPHIVHIDPVVPVAIASAGLLPAKAIPSDPPTTQGTFQITETFASTKPYPPWWRDSTQTISPSSSSAEDMVLDRNICLVDTPGYQDACRPLETVTQVSQYIEAHLQRSRLDNLDDDNVLKTIGEGGGLLVDAVLYMIPSSGLTSIDVHYMRQLESFTNVIPLLAQADTLSAEQIRASKGQIERQLVEADLGLLSLGSSPIKAANPKVYAISSELETNHDIMDASLLMSSEYMQPLLPTDLPGLLDSILSSTGAAWLRHGAAKKMLAWRSRHRIANKTRSTFAMPSESSLETRLLPTRTGTRAPLAMSRAPRYALYEESFCRVQLTNWAADLQRSLANERAGRERRAQVLAATWPREARRQDGLETEDARTALALTCAKGRVDKQHSNKRRRSTGSDPSWALVRNQDPLGLLQLKADFRCHTLEMVGGLGILGGLAWLLGN